MRLRIPSPVAAILSLCVVMSSSSGLQAQSGCARTALPAIQTSPNRMLVPTSPTAQRFRSNRVRLPATIPVLSPYYANEPESAGSNEIGLFVPMRNVNRTNKPAEWIRPTAKEVTQPETPQKPAKPSRPTVAERIRLRYADPRVVRMLRQLTPQGAESFYLEVSELIDDRHLTPATYAQRVDGALDHLTQALDVPSFVETAGVRGTDAEISAFREDLQKLRSQIRVRSTNDAIAVLRDVQNRASRSIAINPSAIGLEFLYGATDSLDQFSMLLPPEKNGGPSVGLSDNLVGIGVEIESHPLGLRILKLLPGGPAAQADFRNGDIITHINDKEIKQLEMSRTVDLIVGPVGSPVRIQATRGNRSGNVTLIRQQIALHSVVDVRMEDRQHGVGYLKLEQFADSTMNEIDDALLSLHHQGMKSLIVDLRGNPGGLLTTAIALSDRFLSSGTIVSTKGRTRADNSKETAQYSNTWKIPLIVLIDHNSASASEIFAAAIQENHRGLIVGETSYGKGTVQTLFPLQTFPAALRLTTAKFYSPEGREMAGVGVTPDIKVSAGPAESRQGDEVLNEAIRRMEEQRTKTLTEGYRRSTDASTEYNVAA